jgi:hypothetical protein
MLIKITKYWLRNDENGVESAAGKRSQDAKWQIE